MTIDQPLSLFISSKMMELIDERLALQEALKVYNMRGWLWEKDAGARPEPIQSTYLKEVEACDIYIGLFWLGYGQYTIEEYEHARKKQKPCLIYEKNVRVDQRSSELTAFLNTIHRVNDGLTSCYFKDAAELTSRVQEDVMRLLTTTFRNNRRQPDMNVQNRSGSITTRASDHSIAVHHSENSQITLHNYNTGRPDDKK